LALQILSTALDDIARLFMPPPRLTAEQEKKARDAYRRRMRKRGERYLQMQAFLMREGRRIKSWRAAQHKKARSLLFSKSSPDRRTRARTRARYQALLQRTVRELDRRQRQLINEIQEHDPVGNAIHWIIEDREQVDHWLRCAGISRLKFLESALARCEILSVRSGALLKEYVEEKSGQRGQSSGWVLLPPQQTRDAPPIEQRLELIDAGEARRFTRLEGDALRCAEKSIERHLDACLRLGVKPDRAAIREIITDAPNAGRAPARERAR
jgi:hypothetical protein